MPPSNNQQVSKEPLKWLFKAYFNDESVIEQPEDDRSIHHVEGAEHNPSAFSDVLDRELDLVAFALYSSAGDHVMVDLKSGNFDVNGLPVCAHNQDFQPQLHKLKLVFFRETRIDMDHSGTPIRHYVNRYFIGWSTTINGKVKKQVTLAVG